MDDHHADELLRRALIEPEASAAVALRVGGLPVCESITVVFHGRRDLGTIQTYVANGGKGAGAAVTASELLRVPCDLDLADAADRDEAEELYGDYQLAIEAATDRLAELRDTYARSLEKDDAEQYVGEFNRSVVDRWRELALTIEES